MGSSIFIIQENQMNVLVLTRYSRMGASSRLRMLQYIETGSLGDARFEIYPLLDDAYLRTIYAKKRVSLLSLARAYCKRLLVLFRVRKFDVVWIEKELFPNFPSWFEYWLARSGIPYLVDYDDAIFHNYDVSLNPFKRLLKNKIRNVMRHAALVVPGNPYLAHHALEAGARRVEIFPTVIDLQRYSSPDKFAGEKPFVIGWIGSPSTVKFLRPLLPVLKRLAAIFPIELAVIGGQLDATECNFIRYIAWQEKTEVMEIHRFDVGIMPLVDEPWERGKNGGKLIQYMACGKAVIASPVGVNVEIVQAGVNGLLADTEEAWFNALSMLITNPEVREKMGQKGRAMVEEKYCVQVTGPRLLHLLRQVVAESKGVKRVAFQ